MKRSLIFLLGIGMGTVLGVLVAPEAGKITRRKIRDEADKLIDQAMQKKNTPSLEPTRPDEDHYELPSKVEVTESRYTF